MTTIDGKTLAECFALVARSGLELDGLRDVLDIMLVEQLTASRASLPCVLAGGAESTGRMDDSQWVWTDIASSLPLKAKGPGMRPIERYLGYQISMTGDGIAIPGYAEPLLHVFCSVSPVSFEDGLYTGFPLGEVEDNPFQIVCDRLILWGNPAASTWNECEWVYSLRLMALNSPADLKTYVVDPALALLKGGDICTVLQDAWLDKIHMNEGGQALPVPQDTGLNKMEREPIASPLIRYPAKSLLVSK
jgi:hypothetical protein